MDDNTANKYAVKALIGEIDTLEEAIKETEEKIEEQKQFKMRLEFLKATFLEKLQTYDEKLVTECALEIHPQVVQTSTTQ